MSNNTTDRALDVLKAIKAEVNCDVIKDHKMSTLFNMETCKETGFAVILTLSKKYDYKSAVLDDWRKRLKADDYMISIKSNQLRVRFNVHFSHE